MSELHGNMRKEFRRIRSRIREKGICYYFAHPHHFTRYGYYVLQALKRRWPAMADVIYVLDMQLSPRVLNTHVLVHCIRSLEPLLDFAKEREKEDIGWKGGAYVKELESRFNQADWCFGAEFDKKIVSVIFVSKGSCYLGPVGYTLKLPDRTVGFYDAYTLSAYRGRKLYSVVFQTAVNTCLGDGYHTAWMGIMPHNVVSLRTHEKLGMRHIFYEIKLCQRWGFRWHKARSVDIDVAAILKECQIRNGIG